MRRCSSRPQNSSLFRILLLQFSLVNAPDRVLYLHPFTPLNMLPRSPKPFGPSRDFYSRFSRSSGIMATMLPFLPIVLVLLLAWTVYSDLAGGVKGVFTRLDLTGTSFMQDIVQPIRKATTIGIFTVFAAARAACTDQSSLPIAKSESTAIRQLLRQALMAHDALPAFPALTVAACGPQTLMQQFVPPTTRVSSSTLTDTPAQARHGPDRTPLRRPLRERSSSRRRPCRSRHSHGRVNPVPSQNQRGRSCRHR